MTEINRRKFLSIFGFISVGGLIRYQDDAKALEISVNRFNNDKKVNLQNIHSIAINIKDTRITSNNIDYSKDAELSIYAKVEDQDIGKIKSKDIKLQNSGTVLDDETIYIDEPELFSEDNFNPNKKSLDIYLKFELKHPSIRKAVTKQIKYKLDITPSGELVTHSFSKYDNFDNPDDNTINKTKVVSETNLPILTEDNTFEQIKTLIGGGMTKDNTSYDLPSGVIDINGLEFQYGTVRNNQDIQYGKEEMAESITGSNLNVLTDKTGFDQLKTLIGGGMTKNESSYNIPSGCIDIDEIQFVYSTARDYRDIHNGKPDFTVFHLK